MYTRFCQMLQCSIIRYNPVETDGQLSKGSLHIFFNNGQYFRPFKILNVKRGYLNEYHKKVSQTIISTSNFTLEINLNLTSIQQKFRKCYHVHFAIRTLELNLTLSETQFLHLYFTICSAWEQVWVSVSIYQDVFLHYQLIKSSYLVFFTSVVFYQKVKDAQTVSR